MATLVCFHAHPDDESITTAGVMAGAAAEGHRVVLVVATKGEHGEVEDGFLSDGETLGERREAETRASARVLGASRVEFLGYVDSGMVGTDTTENPDCFWQADVDEAAQRLAAILTEEEADILTIYDANGNYGHPDHIQVHTVGVRAAEMAGTERVFEATANRDAFERQMTKWREAGIELEGLDDEDFVLGLPESELTTAVDVSPHIHVKRASMQAHASQIAEQSFFLAMSESDFTEAFGTEWYVHRGVSTPVNELETSLFLA